MTRSTPTTTRTGRKVNPPSTHDSEKSVTTAETSSSKLIYIICTSHNIKSNFFFFFFLEKQDKSAEKTAQDKLRSNQLSGSDIECMYHVFIM